jgi:hypothetical protein
MQSVYGVHSHGNVGEDYYTTQHVLYVPLRGAGGTKLGFAIKVSRKWISTPRIYFP